jgi:hypothetical protein
LRPIHRLFHSPVPSPTPKRHQSAPVPIQ